MESRNLGFIWFIPYTTVFKWWLNNPLVFLDGWFLPLILMWFIPLMVSFFNQTPKSVVYYFFIIYLQNNKASPKSHPITMFIGGTVSIPSHRRFMTLFYPHDRWLPMEYNDDLPMKNDDRLNFTMETWWFTYEQMMIYWILPWKTWWFTYIWKNIIIY